MLENLLRKFTLYLFKSCSNFFINHIISRINHEFFLEKRVQYTQFVFFLISTLAKLFESNFQAVKGLDSRGPSETNKVRGCFEFLTASRGRIRALFPPLSSPPLPLFVFSLQPASQFISKTRIYEFSEQCTTRGSISGQQWQRCISVPSIARIFLRSSCQVCRIDHLYRTILVRNRLSLLVPLPCVYIQGHPL